MNRNKAAKPDEIVIEMLLALDDFRINKITEILNEIYDSGEIGEDLNRAKEEMNVSSTEQSV